LCHVCVDVKCRKVILVDQAKKPSQCDRIEPAQVDRIVERRRSNAKDFAEQAALRSEPAQKVNVLIPQCRTGLLNQGWPVAFFRQLDAALVGHLQKKQISQVLDKEAIVDSVTAKCVPTFFQFLNDIAHDAPFTIEGDAAYSSLAHLLRPGAVWF
jgi:hypothetical protein